MRLLTILAMALATACAPVAPVAPVQPVAVQQDATPVKLTPAADEAGCLAQKGTWSPICRMQRPACVLTYSDAGKTCSDSSQCQGRCVAPSGTAPQQPGAPVTGICSTNSNPCGCSQRLENGQPTPLMCVD